MVGERIASALDREPITRKVSDRFQERGTKVRGRIDGAAMSNTPKFENRNLGGGVAIGALQAAVADALEDVIGVPFGAETEMVNINNNASRNGNSGVEYTVNVNAPTQTMAEARALIESSTGYTGYLTDELEVQGAEVVKTRVLRDTFEIDVFVQD